MQLSLYLRERCKFRLRKILPLQTLLKLRSRQLNLQFRTVSLLKNCLCLRQRLQFSRNKVPEVVMPVMYKSNNIFMEQV